MQKREVKSLTPSDLQAYLEIYLNAYPAGKNLSQECYRKYGAQNLQSLEEYRHVNFFGLFEDGVLIAAMKLINFNINLFGQMRKAAGLMALGVHPLHKRKGAAREMVRFFEDYTVESGAAVSLLLPFRMDFYRKLGYGCGSKLDEYHIPMEYLPENKQMSQLRLLDKSSLGQIITCHCDFAQNNHGALYKFEEEIRGMREDDEIRYLGCFQDSKASRMKGYVAFRFVSTSDCNYTMNLIDVKELVYEDQETLRILLGGLRMQSDLAQSVKIRTGEPDFHHLLQSAQDLSGNYIDYGFLQTNLSAVGTMYKIPQIQKFVEATDYREFPQEKLTMGFRVLDELKEEEKQFSLLFSTKRGDCSHWAFDQSKKTFDQANVHVSCKLSDLSSLFMGSAEFGGLARLGVMRTDNPDYIGRLDRLFHVCQKPFTNTDY